MSDLIERQDALDAIDKAFERSNQLNAYIRAFMMNAISEVKKLPPAQPKHDENPCQEQGDSDKFGVKTGETCADCISRQAAIDACIKVRELHAYDEIEEIKHLPSAQPERKMGKWIEQDDGWDGIYYECSVCREPFTLIDGTPSDNLYNFCPNCGADMREGQNEHNH